MRFFAAAALSFSVFLQAVSGAAIIRSVSASGLTNELRNVTSLYDAVTAAANSVYSGMDANSVLDTTQNLNSDLQWITNQLSEYMNSVYGDAFDAQSSADISDAYGDFVQGQIIMLNALTEKHAVFAQYSMTAPIAANLRALQDVDDSFASAVISATTGQTDSLMGYKNTLDQSLSSVISQYDQLCVPGLGIPVCLPLAG